MKTTKLKIISPERILFEEEVAEVVIPTVSGMVGILPNHAPLV